MNKKVIFCCFILLTTIAHGGVLDDLRGKPASQYDMGLLEMELGAFFMSREMAGQEIGDTDFEIIKMRVEEQQDRILFVTSLEGKSRDMSKDLCKEVNTGLAQGSLAESLYKDIWPDLNDKQYAELKEVLLITTELVAEENQSFKIRCTE